MPTLGSIFVPTEVLTMIIISQTDTVGIVLLIHVYRAFQRIAPLWICKKTNLSYEGARSFWHTTFFFTPSKKFFNIPIFQCHQVSPQSSENLTGPQLLSSSPRSWNQPSSSTLLKICKVHGKKKKKRKKNEWARRTLCHLAFRAPKKIPPPYRLWMAASVQTIQATAEETKNLQFFYPRTSIQPTLKPTAVHFAPEPKSKHVLSTCSSTSHQTQGPSSHDCKLCPPHPGGVGEMLSTASASAYTSSLPPSKTPRGSPCP